MRAFASTVHRMPAISTSAKLNKPLRIRWDDRQTLQSADELGIYNTDIVLPDGLAKSLR
jgi:hypothetical protein